MGQRAFDAAQSKSLEISLAVFMMWCTKSLGVNLAEAREKIESGVGTAKITSDVLFNVLRALGFDFKIISSAGRVMTRLAWLGALFISYVASADPATECTLPTKKEGALHYKLVGDSSKPPLVLIPGNGNDMSSFAKVIPELTKHYRVLLVDQPGHGQSDENPKNDYSAEAMAAALHDVLTKLKLGKVTLLGHSLGGRTAMSYLDQFPDEVDKLVLEDMESCAREKTVADKQDPAPKAAKLKSALDKEFPTYAELAAEVHRHIPFAKKEHGDQWIEKNSCRVKATGKWKLTARPWVYELYRHQTSFKDFTPILMKYRKVPQLVMVSGEPAKTASVRLPCLDDMKKRNPDLNVKGFPGSAHTIHSSQPTEFLDALNTFTGISVKQPPLDKPEAGEKSEKGKGRHS